tara:strand:+ start:252 stop:680 length:429 start_codon:yes stop_codon:yes gene_type:complete
MSDQPHREELFSHPVRAGKRTYFFDVKATRGQDLYMTITESKRRFEDDGSVHYQKHKIFLYREDFANFEHGFIAAVDKIQELMASGNYRDPMAERLAQEQQPSSSTHEASNDVAHDASDHESVESKAEENTSDSDDISFDDL